jgi:antitoxin (DNA-binding transcriptional repressor) of toxin-antitoxin stability system
VRRGEEIVIAHAGRPVAKLVPYSSDRPTRQGVIRTQIVVHDDRQA